MTCTDNAYSWSQTAVHNYYSVAVIEWFTQRCRNLIYCRWRIL